MFGKKCCRAPQQGGVKVVAQIGDHAEAGVIHKICAGVVADSFEDGGRNQRESHDRPGIREMRRHELLEVDRVMRAGDHEELNVLRAGRGIQHPIKYGTNQQIFEGVESADGGHEQNRRKYLPPVRHRVADQARQLPHGPPAGGRPQTLAAGRMDIRYKALFYLSRAPVECGFRFPGLRNELSSRRSRRLVPGYFGMSRCTIFTRYPACRRCLPTSSAIMTERCCPPVHPNAIVK